MFHLAARVLLVVAFIILITQAESAPEPTRITIPFTDNDDLNRVRLFNQANGTWTPEMLASYRNLVAEPSTFAHEPQLTVDRQFQSLTQAGEWRQAERFLQTLLDGDSQNPQYQLWMALLKLPSTDAEPYLQVVANGRNPHQGLAVRLLGVMSVEGYTVRDVAVRLIESEEWVFAERLFTLQIEQDNLDALSYAYRGFVRNQQGEDGLGDIERAIALEPTSALPYYMLGLHERQQDQLDTSLDAFMNAYLLDKQNPAMLAELAHAYALNDQLNLAENWYQEALAILPDDERFITLLADFYANEQYKLDNVGMVFIQTAVEEHPANAELQAILGWAYLQTDQLEAAHTALHQAFDLNPTSPRVRFYLANLLEQEEDTVEAIAHYFFVTQSSNPYTEAAQQSLQRLTG